MRIGSFFVYSDYFHEVQILTASHSITATHYYFTEFMKWPCSNVILERRFLIYISYNDQGGRDSC